jgi:tetratricopeptide (TPR) repeat protein
MRKTIIFVILLLSSIFMFSFESNAVTTNSAPYDTYTIGPNGRYILTQTAYEPSGYLSLQNFTLKNPEDMFIKDDLIYIADTGNSRILKIDLNHQVSIFTSSVNVPMGIFVDDEFNVYVADKGDLAIHKFDQNGDLLESFYRPTEPLFGTDTLFVPLKITVGPRGVMYIVGEGSTSGIIQLDYLGGFLGFFGTNETTNSIFQELAKIFNVTLARNIPVSPKNVTIDQKGSLFTVSPTSDRQLKKFNISSQMILEKSTSNRLSSVFVNDFDNIFTISEEGIITEYDSYGNLIFEFGGLDVGNRNLGLFLNPVDIKTDSNYDLYVLDKGLSQIHILSRSEFAMMVHQGIINFKNGVYNVLEWENVLRLNSVFSLANSSIARALYRQGEYQSALEYYLIANNQSGYSDAFWQIRYSFMQNSLSLIFIILILLFVTQKSLKLIDHKYQIFNPIREKKKNFMKIQFVSEFKYLFYIFRHPLDAFYELKRNQRSSYLTATIIYLLTILLSILTVYLTAFIFNTYLISEFNIFRHTAIVASIILLFVFANYLISTLNSGEGFFKDVYINTAYALAPYVVFTIPIIILSHMFTLNEVFIYDAMIFIRDSWTILLILTMIKQVHNYTVKELIKNVFLTIFTMVMIVLIIFLLFLLTNQLFDYVFGIIKEVMLRG